MFSGQNIIEPIGSENKGKNKKRKAEEESLTIQSGLLVLLLKKQPKPSGIRERPCVTYIVSSLYRTPSAYGRKSALPKKLSDLLSDLIGDVEFADGDKVMHRNLLALCIMLKMINMTTVHHKDYVRDFRQSFVLLCAEPVRGGRYVLRRHVADPCAVFLLLLEFLPGVEWKDQSAGQEVKDLLEWFCLRKE